jgi:hypothetical protein
MSIEGVWLAAGLEVIASYETIYFGEILLAVNRVGEYYVYGLPSEYRFVSTDVSRAEGITLIDVKLIKGEMVVHSMYAYSERGIISCFLLMVEEHLLKEKLK